MLKLHKRNKLLYGVGINDSDYNTQSYVDGKQIICKYYSTWRDMLKRCYDPKTQARYLTYIGCAVCEE